ncbi:hypothetical protein BB560_001719 [Smittium megazygosporum]|uniref:HTH tetR-type domain-containing protein n=1 Tax=Smittium megazygosporum TaxID=133381 RepID=A0A2T9ZGS1_9FUNG|nr:hypothetical protein BB560_001719 [Smittium megazygosporum]
MYSTQTSSSVREKLLELSLQNVKKFGFTQDSVIAACKELELSPSAYTIVYDKGLGLINYFFSKSLKTTIAAAESPSFPTDESPDYLLTFNFLNENIDFIFDSDKNIGSGIVGQ